WVHGFGEGYVKGSFSYYSSSDSFNQGVSTGLQFESFTYRVYAELGLPANFQFAFDVPYQVAVNESGSGIEYNNHTFGDVNLRLDYGLPTPIPMSINVGVKIPAYTPIGRQGDDGVVTLDGQTWTLETFPDVGDGQVDLTATISAGYSFPTVPIWLNADLGYQHRFGVFVDGLYAALGVGGYVWPGHIAVGVYSNGIFTLTEDEDPDVRASKEYIYTQGYLLITGAPWVPDLGLTFAVGGTPYAEQTSKGIDYSVGLSYQF
ncbi:MAG: hypothetical protein KDD69_20290, partial [Bdellovibrionales bacterium]|nr:hypothetical protein [Bdellovibrionales bacterium]